MSARVACEFSRRVIQMVLWKDYSYITGRSKPVGVVHCHSHHDQEVALRVPGADRPGYSVRLRAAEAARCRCRTCGSQGRDMGVSGI